MWIMIICFFLLTFSASNDIFDVTAIDLIRSTLHCFLLNSLHTLAESNSDMFTIMNYDESRPSRYLCIHTGTITKHPPYCFLPTNRSFKTFCFCKNGMSLIRHNIIIPLRKYEFPAVIYHDHQLYSLSEACTVIGSSYIFVSFSSAFGTIQARVDIQQNRNPFQISKWLFGNKEVKVLVGN